MARRSGDRQIDLSPRARRVVGWVAAAALVIGIALAVRVVGGAGDGVPTASPGGSAAAGGPLAIAFGTSLDPATGLVAPATRTTRFAAGDTFAYSVADMPPPATVSVEVERIAGGPLEVVQRPSRQVLGDAAVVAFAVPADALLEDFGPGEYRMRIYAEGETTPAAEGVFELVAASSPAEPTG